LALLITLAALLSALLSRICLLRFDKAGSGSSCSYVFEVFSDSLIRDKSLTSTELSAFSISVFFKGTGADGLGVSSLNSINFFCGKVVLNSLISFIFWCYSVTDGTNGELI